MIKNYYKGWTLLIIFGPKIIQDLNELNDVQFNAKYYSYNYVLFIQ